VGEYWSGQANLAPRARLKDRLCMAWRLVVRRLSKKLKFKRRAEKVKDLVPANVAEHLKPKGKKEEELTPLEDVPRITNETIAVHREEVLKGARKYIYPLQHSKHRIIMLTTWILVAAISTFLVYSILALYKLNQYNTFLYRTTQVVPFPIARVGDNFVAYENYLFELRHFIHYYQNQLGLNFEGKDKEQLERFRTQALDGVVNNAYVKRIAEVRNQNRLGSNNKVFSDVLRDYWGWSISDFKRSLKEEILSEKVVAKLDKTDMDKANSALFRLKNGEDFAKVASEVSNDPNAKANGGDYGFPITRTNPNVPPQAVSALYKLQPGQISAVINTGSTLEIVKNMQASGDSITAKHIVINLKDISDYTKDLKKQKPAHIFVKH
jgi:hypothetical protein